MSERLLHLPVLWMGLVTSRLLTAALSTNDVEIDRNIAARFSREPPSRGARGLRLHGLPEAVKGRE